MKPANEPHRIHVVSAFNVTFTTKKLQDNAEDQQILDSPG